MQVARNLVSVAHNMSGFYKQDCTMLNRVTERTSE